MPVRDARDTLAQAIESILCQRGVRLELIIADDGSRDGSLEIANKYSRQDKRVRLLCLPRQGLVAALNTALSQARGEIIARMDADDISRSGRLARQLALLGKADLASCRVRCFSQNNLKSGLQRYERWINSLISHRAMIRELFVECPIPHPTLMIKRRIIRAVGGYRLGHFPEDYDLVFRCWLAGARFAKVPAVLLDWRDSTKRLQRQSARYSRDNFRKLKLRYLRQSHLRGGVVTVWGAGRNGKPWARLLQQAGLEVAGFIEISPRKIGKLIYGLPVFPPKEIDNKARGIILCAVGAQGAREEIRGYLKGIGRREEKDFLFVA